MPVQTLHVMSKRLRSNADVGVRVLPYCDADNTIRKQETARGPPSDKTTFVHRMKTELRFFCPYFSCAASEQLALEVGYSPPTPTPTAPLAMVNHQKRAETLPPMALEAVAKMAPRTRSPVAVTTAGLRPTRSQMTPTVI